MHFIDNIPQLIGIQRAITWSVDDYSKLQDFMAKIRLYNWYKDYQSAFNLTALLNIFIRKTWNDHHPSLLHDIKVEAIDSDIGTNKITASGIIGMVAILSNQSNKFFNYFSMGTGTTPETIGQKSLIAEVIRISVLTDGSIAARGSVWNHVANLGYGAPSGTYYEFGIHDGPLEPSRMFSRSVLPAGLSHVQNESFVTASHSTIFTAK